MDDLRKVSSLQLYSFWKTLSIGLLVIIGMLTVSHVLPFYASPIISLLAIGVLYGIIYQEKTSGEGKCLVVIYALLNAVIGYTFCTIIFNILDIWSIVQLPKELMFLNDPYIPSLLMDPIAFLSVTVMYVRRKHLNVCANCKLKADGLYQNGRTGAIFRYESTYQLRNLMFLFGMLSVIIWLYYNFVYIRLAVNARDWYVFTWLTIISFIIDELYFIYRYYNLYLDLKENDEIISQEELTDMTAKTYIRFYVMCGNYVYLDPNTVDPNMDYREVIDTPFLTKRSVNGIPLPEVKNIVKRLTEVQDGELRFYYGRKSSELKNHSVLRYFYFLPGKPEDYPNMPVKGEWMDFEDVKRIYTRTPGRFSAMAVGDLSRLATIILTEKIFDENGRRKTKIKSYNPSFNLIDVKNSQLDFQDDKWVKISMFNSDTRFFELKKLFKGKPKTS